MKLAKLTDNERGILSSAMADGSCASLLSRSPGWVRRQRALLSGGAGSVEIIPASGDAECCAFEQRRPDAARYMRRFYSAGWAIREIAWLFDASNQDTAEVVL